MVDNGETKVGSGRKQRVVMNGVCAEWSDVKARVPQGSILGPLLFITFVNDLPSSVIYSQVSLYADDTTVYFAHRDASVVMNKLNEDLTAVTQWIENGLKLNVSKTHLQGWVSAQRRTAIMAVWSEPLWALCNSCTGNECQR